MHLEYGYITNHKSATERNRATIAMDNKWHQEIFQNHICPSWCKIQVYLLCRRKPCPKKGNKMYKVDNTLGSKGGLTLTFEHQ